MRNLVGFLSVAPVFAARIEVLQHRKSNSDVLHQLDSSSDGLAAERQHRSSSSEADEGAWPWDRADITGPSPWDQYRSDSTLYCKPWVTKSQCADEDYRGLVVYFHGYSACAEQVKDIAPQLNAACLDVLAPTLPGHGGQMINCDEAASRAEEGAPQCTVRMDNGMGFDLTDLPTHADEFRSFAYMINEKVAEERNFRARQTGVARRHLEVGAFGLSFGAAMATFAIRSEEGLYSKQLLVNPFYGMGSEEFDIKALACDDKVNLGSRTRSECREELILSILSSLGIDSQSNWFLEWVASNRAGLERALFVNVAKLSDHFGHMDTTDIDITVLRSAFDATTVWQESCQAIYGGRKGICAFKQVHALASHSFCFHSLVDVVDSFGFRLPPTQIISTERDGRTRNGFSYAAARAMGRHHTSMCMYRFRNGTDTSNPAEYWNDENSMKHAALQAPGWWVEKLFRECTEFLTGDGSKISGAYQWDGGRTQCQELPLDMFALYRRPSLNRLVMPDVAPTTQFVFMSALFPFLHALDSVADIRYLGRSRPVVSR